MALPPGLAVKEMNGSICFGFGEASSHWPSLVSSAIASVPEQTDLQNGLLQEAREPRGQESPLAVPTHYSLCNHSQQVGFQTLQDGTRPGAGFPSCGEQFHQLLPPTSLRLLFRCLHNGGGKACQAAVDLWLSCRNLKARDQQMWFAISCLCGAPCTSLVVSIQALTRTDPA